MAAGDAAAEPAAVSRGTLARGLASFALGQLVSLLITGSGVCSTLLANNGVDIPVAQSSISYLLLSLHLPVALRCRQSRAACVAGEGGQLDHPRGGCGSLSAPLWQYALWALCDVEANCLVVAAFQYTSIVSVDLLDCFAIPSAILWSSVLMRARYTSLHVVACCVCVVGLAVAVLSDSAAGRVGPSPRGPAWLGDALVLAGAALYGLSNVLQERLLKGGCGRSEALGMLGACGTLVSLLQAAVVERGAILQSEWSPRMVACLVGYQLCIFAIYVLSSIFFTIADATLFNLSLLTSDCYSALFAWKVQRGRATWLYGLAFLLALGGLCLYHAQPPPAASPPRELRARVGERLAATRGEEPLTTSHCDRVGGRASA